MLQHARQRYTIMKSEEISMKMRLILIASILICAFCLSAPAQDEKDGWKNIFNGKNLDGWKANDTAGEFFVEDGMILGKGGRCHLYFMEELQNFELKIDVYINDKGNSGVYVKAPWVDNNWPVEGFELQVNSTQRDPVKTGSIYNILKLFESPSPADQWFTYHLIVEGDVLTVKVNDKVLYTYVDPAAGMPEIEGLKRISQKGYIALQQHDPGSKPKFKNIYLKKLP